MGMVNAGQARNPELSIEWPEEHYSYVSLAAAPGVILDLSMPNACGYDLLQLVEAVERYFSFGEQAQMWRGVPADRLARNLSTKIQQAHGAACRGGDVFARTMRVISRMPRELQADVLNEIPVDIVALRIEEEAKNPVRCDFVFDSLLMSMSSIADLWVDQHARVLKDVTPEIVMAGLDLRIGPEKGQWGWGNKGVGTGLIDAVVRLSRCDCGEMKDAIDMWAVAHGFVFDRKPEKIDRDVEILVMGDVFPAERAVLQGSYGAGCDGLAGHFFVGVDRLENPGILVSDNLKRRARMVHLSTAYHALRPK